jgi:hypothetical protein
MLQITLNILLQLLLFTLTEASPLKAESHGNALNFGIGGGILGFIVLILDIIVWSTYQAVHYCQTATLPTGTAILVVGIVE